MKAARKTTVFFSLILLFSVLLFITSLISDSLAQTIDNVICRRIRLILSDITSIVPFSVFEISVFLSPFLIAAFVKYVACGKNDYRVRFFRVLSAISLLVSLYILTIGIPYKAPSPFSKYGKAVTPDELFATASALRKTINDESEFISDEPTFEEICVKTGKAFDKATSKYRFSGGRILKPKPMITSKLVSYTGALAIYSFPTGEVNVNTNAPSYTIPFTVLHEFGHSCGLMSEADANFFAYLASLESDSHFIRYSAALSVLEYLLADLKKVNFNAYLCCYNGLSERARNDIKSWQEYSEKYHRGWVFKAFENSNRAHLKTWDMNGSVSYVRVTVYVTNYLNSA